MGAAHETELRPGQARSECDAAFLKRYNAWMQLPIIVSAVLPLVIIPESSGWVGVVVGVVTWLVFLADTWCTPVILSITGTPGWAVLTCSW